MYFYDFIHIKYPEHRNIYSMYGNVYIIYGNIYRDTFTYGKYIFILYMEVKIHTFIYIERKISDCLELPEFWG